MLVMMIGSLSGRAFESLLEAAAAAAATANRPSYPISSYPTFFLPPLRAPPTRFTDSGLATFEMTLLDARWIDGSISRLWLLFLFLLSELVRASGRHSRLLAFLFISLGGGKKERKKENKEITDTIRMAKRRIRRRVCLASDRRCQ